MAQLISVVPCVEDVGVVQLANVLQGLHTPGAGDKEVWAGGKKGRMHGARCVASVASHATNRRPTPHQQPGPASRPQPPPPAAPTLTTASIWSSTASSVSARVWYSKSRASPVSSSTGGRFLIKDACCNTALWARWGGTQWHEAAAAPAGRRGSAQAGHIRLRAEIKPVSLARWGGSGTGTGGCYHKSCRKQHLLGYILVGLVEGGHPGNLETCTWSGAWHWWYHHGGLGVAKWAGPAGRQARREAGGQAEGGRQAGKQAGTAGWRQI